MATLNSAASNVRLDRTPAEVAQERRYRNLELVLEQLQADIAWLMANGNRPVADCVRAHSRALIAQRLIEEERKRLAESDQENCS